MSNTDMQVPSHAQRPLPMQTLSHYITSHRLQPSHHIQQTFHHTFSSSANTISCINIISDTNSISYTPILCAITKACVYPNSYPPQIVREVNDGMAFFLLLRRIMNLFFTFKYLSLALDILIYCKYCTTTIYFCSIIIIVSLVKLSIFLRETLPF